MRINLDFCDYYKYPENIKNQFREILSICKSHRANSVILTGSAATGDLKYEFVGEELRIYSDYDILIIIDKNTAYRQLRTDLISLSPHFNKDFLSPRVDFSFVYLNQLWRLPRNIYTYDLKKKGITIAGEDVKAHLPHVDKNNIAIKSESERIIYILWSLLLYYPLLIPNEKTEHENATKFYRHLISRRILTLVPLLLLLEGDLIADISEGVALIKSKYLNSKMLYFMGEEFIYLLDVCLKKGNCSEYIFETEILYKKSIECINNALRYLVYKKTNRDINNQKEIIDSIMKYSNHLFNDNCLKTTVKNSMSILMNIKQIKDYEIIFLYSYVIKKSALLLSALLDFHWAAISYKGGERRGYFLKRGMKRLTNDKGLKSILETRYWLSIFLVKNRPYPWLLNYDCRKINFNQSD